MIMESRSSLAQTASPDWHLREDPSCDVSLDNAGAMSRMMRGQAATIMSVRIRCVQHDRSPAMNTSAPAPGPTGSAYLNIHAILPDMPVQLACTGDFSQI
jgi:hypothetical protein